jgi:hypothetical protein
MYASGHYYVNFNTYNVYIRLRKCFNRKECHSKYKKIDILVHIFNELKPSPKGRL